MMNDVQKKGFVGIPRDLFEAILSAGLSKRQWAVYMSVVRLTYGWNKSAAPVSPSLVEQLCNVKRKHVQATLKELSELGMIQLLEPGVGSRPPVYEVVEDFETWSLVPPKQGRNSAPKTGAQKPLSPQNRGAIVPPKQGRNEKPQEMLVPPKQGLIAPLKQGHTIDNRHDLDYPTEDLRSTEETPQPAAKEQQQQKVDPVLDCWRIITNRCAYLRGSPPADTRRDLTTWIRRSLAGGFTPEQIQQACYDSASSAMDRRSRDPTIRSPWRLAVTELDQHLRHRRTHQGPRLLTAD